MTLSLDETREMLEGEYYRDNLFFLFERLFPNFVKCIASPPISSKKFKSCTLIGTSEKPDLKVYEVILPKEIEKQRVGITKEMFRIMNASGDFSAIVLFVNEDHQNYRLSLLTNYFVNDDGVYRKEKSNYHRYSYYLGVGTKTKTVYDFLYSKGSVKSLDELRDRFSVDIVNNQFYSEIAKAFTKLIGGSFGGQKYERILRFSQEVSPNKYSEFGVRLLGRLIFCWFLKEKRSENGTPLVPDILFAGETIDRTNNYYGNILQNLFFETLNTPWEKRKKSLCNEYFSSIPYLNGGLFSPHHDDFYDDVDSRSVYIPNQWFKDLFAVLREYNFTVDESTSYDVELSIDPEMLGRIFENLLAEINPETGESARKNTGSFYTPRDIVDFMVNASLYEHLVNTTSVKPEKIETLIRFGDNDNVAFDNNERIEIVNSLYNIKILDPACGSGAFPMGLLQKIVYILQEIDPDNGLWLEKIDNDDSIDEETKKEIEWSSIDYIRKLLVIKNSIYGIDIQPIAAEISRLRCFLSIIIEEKIDDDKPNRGVRPLPNLDFKFAIGNTLIPLENKNQHFSLFDDYELMDKLNEIRSIWFAADSIVKSNLKERLVLLQREMSESIRSTQYLESEKYRRLSRWNPSSSDENDWFDSEWMFGVSGFDIVIGNPPYIEMRDRIDFNNPNCTTKFGDLYNGYNYRSFDKMGDVYCLFYEKGIELLKPNGILSYITSNKWMRTKYAYKLRGFLSEQNPLLLIDFPGGKIFKTATVDVNVLICQKSKNKGKTFGCEATSQCVNDLCNFVKENIKEFSFTNSNIWVLADPFERNIQSKVEKYGVPLSDWHIKINIGISTGYDKAFIIDKKTKNKLIHEDPKNANLIKPILRGKDISRYGYTFNDCYLLFIPWHFPLDNKKIVGVSNKAENEFKREYLSVYDYLLQYKEKLECRDEVGDRYEWYVLKRFGSSSSCYFSEPKIMYSEIVQSPQFYYDETGYFWPGATAFIMTGDDLLPLVLMLNSEITFYIFKKFYAGGVLSGSGVRYKESYLNCLPLPVPNKSDYSILEQYYKMVTSDDENMRKKGEELIDQYLCHRYNFSQDEFDYIKSHAK